LQALYFVIDYVAQHPLVHVLNLIIQKDWPFKKTAEMNRALYEWERRLAIGPPMMTA
jgi:hypothetical protein